MKNGLLPLQKFQGNEQSESGHYMTDFSSVVYIIEKVEG